MKRNFEEALRHRRSYYAIGNESPVSPDVVKKILDDALTYVSFGIQYPVYSFGTVDRRRPSSFLGYNQRDVARDRSAGKF